MNIYEKVQTIRVELKAADIKMTGKNSFAGYDYFELDDFLSPLNDLMQKYSITAYPSFTADIASLTVVNSEKPEEKIVITSPMGTASLKGCHEVQNIGAVETYQRRYLYQAMFDIAESDGLNATQGKPEKPKTTVVKKIPVQKPSDVLNMPGADKADNKTLFVNALTIAKMTPDEGRNVIDKLYGEEAMLSKLDDMQFVALLKELDALVEKGNGID